MRKSLQRVAAGGVAVAASLATVVATAQPAAADTTTFNDGGGHLTTVRVDHGDNIRVKARVGDYNIGSHFSFWLDTDSDDPGPEYRIKVYPNSEVLPIRDVENFADTGSAIECDYRAKADAYGSKYVTHPRPARVPRDAGPGPGLGPGELRDPRPERRRLGTGPQEVLRLGLVGLTAVRSTFQSRLRGGVSQHVPGNVPFG